VRGVSGALGAAIERHRLVVCVGTGGVGKTTVAAALALGAAQRGRRVMVLTIDPARALARALGLGSLAAGGQPVPAEALAAAGIELRGSLDAGMLDQKPAWDAFITRHAPSDAAARAILDNRFYRELSTSFAGATEYMAIEETCRLAEAGRHDLIVLDTPPAAHALAFLDAPERLDPLLDRRVTALLAQPTMLAGRFARMVLRRIEGAVGGGAFADILHFLVALDAVLDGALARTRRARALLRGGAAGYVLVTGPRALVLDETGAFAARLAATDAALAGVVVNRVHRAPRSDPRDIAGLLEQLHGDGDGDAVAWARAAWDDAVAESAAEAAPLAGFLAGLPAGMPRVLVPDGPRDVHALGDLAGLAAALWA
jgi:anion-transporting  ArsA/GET3 family ATPase